MMTDADLDSLLLLSDPGYPSTEMSADDEAAEYVWSRLAASLEPPAPIATGVRYRSRRSPLPTVRVLVPVCAVAAATAALVFGLVPETPTFWPAATAAATFHELAQAASTQNVMALGPGQWLEQTWMGSASASVSQVGTQPSPEAKATINSTSTEWANDQSVTCWSGNSSPAQFASPVARRAWQSAGLLVRPQNPGISCSSVDSVQSAAAGSGAGAFDVSGLPTNPARLAQELEAGTTGIAGLDLLNSPPGPGAGFTRAVLILIGPTVGATPAFNAALLDAMGTMPGVTQLGMTTTYTGQTGVAFAGPSSAGTSTVVLAPSTGALLEARQVQGLGGGGAFVNYAASGGIGQLGGVTRVVLNWLDPVGPPTVVQSLPPAVQQAMNAHPSVPATATIDAVTVPGVTAEQLAALSGSVIDQPGSPSFAFGEVSGNGVWDVGVSVHGTSSNVAGIESALNDSGLFATVQVMGS